jgi:hypothetical protein
MSSADSRVFPPALTALAAVTFPYEDGDDVDYEPYDGFLAADEATEWIRAWTGDDDIDADDLLVFGQDGTGGLAAFWLVDPDGPIDQQPVVFLGSEGETGVVASNLSDYLWLLASGTGPWEVVVAGGGVGRTLPEMEAIAEQFATTPRRPIDELVGSALRPLGTPRLRGAHRGPLPLTLEPIGSRGVRGSPRNPTGSGERRPREPVGFQWVSWGRVHPMGPWSRGPLRARRVLGVTGTPANPMGSRGVG